MSPSTKQAKGQEQSLGDAVGAFINEASRGRCARALHLRYEGSRLAVAHSGSCVGHVEYLSVQAGQPPFQHHVFRSFIWPQPMSPNNTFLIQCRQWSSLLCQPKIDAILPVMHGTSMGFLHSQLPSPLCLNCYTSCAVFSLLHSLAIAEASLSHSVSGSWDGLCLNELGPHKLRERISSWVTGMCYFTRIGS
jgi:hypothetical protein